MVYKGKYLRYSLIQFRRNRLTYLHIVIEHPRNRFVLHNLNAALLSNLLDLLCKIPLTLCQNIRCILLGRFKLIFSFSNFSLK